MEATVDKLEAMFKKTDSDVDYLNRKMDAEFANKDSPEGDPEKMNPGKMLQKIAEIKQEFAAIVKEAEAIKEAQKEAMDFFRGELMTVVETLTKLQENMGTETNNPAELREAQALLGLPQNAVDETPDEPQGAAGEAAMTALPSPDEAHSKTARSEPSKVQSVNESPYDLRSKSNELIEISEEEFLTVSTIVRGRVKLCDINQTYKILWQHFKEEGNSDALSPSDMFKMGLKVTGQTGEAKLKVLRSLKLLQISKKGEVQLT